jgi:hypothetical protein
MAQAVPAQYGFSRKATRDSSRAVAFSFEKHVFVGTAIFAAS